MVGISYKDDIGSRVSFNNANQVSMGPGATKEEIEARVIIRGDKEIGPGLSSSTEERDILNKANELRGTTIGISHDHRMGGIDRHLDDRLGNTIVTKFFKSFS